MVAIDWTRLERQAGRQHDLLTRGQCQAAGMTRDGIAWQVRSGRWSRLHDGVFLTRPGRDDWLTMATAALLAADDGRLAAAAALCGSSAAHLWGLSGRTPDVVEIVVPNRRSVRAPTGSAVRRSMRWDGLVHDTAYPWRTTVPATVLDVATGATESGALAGVARAVQLGLTTAAELRQEMVARGGHRHSKVLRPALADVESGAESGAEILYLGRVERGHALPRSSLQARLLGRDRRNDFAYEEYRVVVEVDGRLGHEQWSDRVRDGRRDRELLVGDQLVTRVFWSDVAVTPCATAAQVGAVLQRRGWAGRARPCRRPGCIAASDRTDFADSDVP